jgi:hypothetical protein
MTACFTRSDVEPLMQAGLTPIAAGVANVLWSFASAFVSTSFTANLS